jgi:predicted O-linked N-acetylglucosamine transferase (SPINDLY family)
LDTHEAARANLQREAKRRGVAANRLFFAPKLAVEDHLARHRAADLFLDTLPYNAHTTASDALWMGLPVVTQCGHTFAGRVCASLLEAAGLPELIATMPQGYEDLALDLARNPDRLRAMKERLAVARTSAPLFDTVRFTRDFEEALISLSATNP